MSLTRKKEKASVIVNDNIERAPNTKKIFNQVNGGEKIFSLFIN
jgi:hypothetical protein